MTRIAVVAVVLVAGGCGGVVPHCTRPLTADELTEVMSIRALVLEVDEHCNEASPRWAEYVETLDARLAVGRVCYGRTRGHPAWAQWGALPRRIILGPGWFELYDVDRALVLLQEACHVRYELGEACHQRVGGCDGWEADYAMWVWRKGG